MMIMKRQYLFQVKIYVLIDNDTDDLKEDLNIDNRSSSEEP